MTDTEVSLLTWMRMCACDGSILMPTADKAFKVYIALAKQRPELPFPDCSTTANFEVMLEYKCVGSTLRVYVRDGFSLRYTETED